MHGRARLIAVALPWLMLSCPGDAPPKDTGWTRTEWRGLDRSPGDRRVGDGANGDGQRCDFAVGCGDPTLHCDVGKCVPCPAGTYNCNGSADCECQGGCDGTSCKGASSCDYYDQDACGGDSSRWCYQNVCIDCSAGWFNCNHTKGCECDSGGCAGTACAGKCSGGECP
jgi:hypothetical protein